MPLASIAPWVCERRHVTLWIGTRKNAADSTILTENAQDPDAREVADFLRAHGARGPFGTTAADDAIQKLLWRPTDADATHANAALDRLFDRANGPYGDHFMNGRASSISFMLPLTSAGGSG